MGVNKMGLGPLTFISEEVRKRDWHGTDRKVGQKLEYNGKKGKRSEYIQQIPCVVMTWRSRREVTVDLATWSFLWLWHTVQ